MCVSRLAQVDWVRKVGRCVAGHRSHHLSDAACRLEEVADERRDKLKATVGGDRDSREGKSQHD